MKGLLPKTGTTSEEDKLEAIKMSKMGAFYLTIEDDQLLPQQHIFDNKISTTAGQVRYGVGEES